MNPASEPFAVCDIQPPQPGWSIGRNQPIPKDKPPQIVFAIDLSCNPAKENAQYCKAARYATLFDDKVQRGLEQTRSAPATNAPGAPDAHQFAVVIPIMGRRKCAVLVDDPVAINRVPARPTFWRWSVVAAA